MAQEDQMELPLIPEARKESLKGNFIIWNPDNAFPPTQIYTTIDRAEQVCKEMAEKYDREFYVCYVKLGFRGSKVWSYARNCWRVIAKVL